MIEAFSWWIALAVFAGYFAVDWLMALCTMSVVKKKALMAANSGAGIYFITGFGVINYTQNWVYILPMVLGSWLGTYLYVRFYK